LNRPIRRTAAEKPTGLLAWLKMRENFLCWDTRGDTNEFGMLEEQTTNLSRRAGQS